MREQRNTLLSESQPGSFKQPGWRGARPTFPARPQGVPTASSRCLLPFTLSARFLVTLVRFVFNWVDTFWRTSNHLWTGQKAQEDTLTYTPADQHSPATLAHTRTT